MRKNRIHRNDKNLSAKIEKEMADIRVYDKQ